MIHSKRFPEPLTDGVDSSWAETEWEGVTTYSKPHPPSPDGDFIHLRQSKPYPVDSQFAGETAWRACVCERKAWQGHLLWYGEQHPEISGAAGIAAARHDATNTAMGYAGVLFY